MGNKSDFDRSNFVLRLLVVKLEGVLIPPVSEWGHKVGDWKKEVELSGEELFPEWVREWNVAEDELRKALVERARKAELRVADDVLEVMDYAHNHSPIRVAILSTGPDDWLRAVVESIGASDLIDLPYSYDRYPQGDRRTLLQFLMNRFIAGRERTLLLGNTPADERLSISEDTRFRSFESAPPDAERPDHWGWTPDRFLDFMKNKQPQN